MAITYNCEEGTTLPSSDNELKILVKKLQREFQYYYDDTNKSLLDHDEKISDMINFIKNNLDNSIRGLLDSMMLSGELDTLIKEIILNTDPVSIIEYGAVGDGITDDTPAFLAALEVETNLYLPKGTYRITRELTIPNACIISGCGEESIIKSEADVTFITTKANTLIENIKMIGNDENTGISVYQTKQILRNISFENFAVGCVNKNSDYIGTVKFVDLNFNRVKTCFVSTTLTNGVSFNRIVAYRFDSILKAHWIEGVGFNNCFFEIGNEGSVILDVPEGKSNCRAMGLSFNSCYIENVTQLLSKVITGIVKFDGCWLFTKGSFYDNGTGSNNLKLLFMNCAFSVPSSLGSAALLFNLSSTHTLVINHHYGLVNGVGGFELKAETNTIGGKVSIDNKILKQTTIDLTTNDKGVIQTGLLTTKHRILCSYGYVKDSSSNVVITPYMSGNNWYVVCKNPANDSLIVNKEIQVRMTYVNSNDIEVV